MKQITQFRGDAAFLSNFFERPVIYDGLKFRNNEAAFQAMKCPGRSKEFCNLTAHEAKKLGELVPLRPDWEEAKERIMYEICLKKFTQNRDLEGRLISTGAAPLIMGNDQGDTEWGVCNGVGKNKLGKILMRIRSELTCD